MSMIKTLETQIKHLIPMAAYCDFSIRALTDRSCEILIPLNDKTTNHLQSLYFGALAVGADLTSGLLAMHHIEHSGHPIVLVFKDFQANFLKRADSDVLFVCEQGEEVAALVARAAKTGGREEATVIVTAWCVDKTTQFADFALTLSLKEKKIAQRA